MCIEKFHARYVFLCFTGLSYSDLKNLQHAHIQQYIDRSRWIVLNRQKTDTASYIPILSFAQQILDKYTDKKKTEQGDYVFKIKTLANFKI